jgi:S-DNA-T family DNA segregation ATPase FtsK/SpoIIIE
MAKPNNPYTTRLRQWWQELRENLSVELGGLLIFCVGGLLFLSLLGRNEPYATGLPWLTGMVGWTAPLMVVTLMVIGGVLMLGRRAGYWSVEAIVGAELLLLALQLFSFLWSNAQPLWEAQIDGGNGGLVGTTLGTLLLAGLGWWPAMAVVLLLGLAGIGMLMRYTPLLYLFVHLGQQLPLLGALWLALRTWLPNRPPTVTLDHQTTAPLARATNFVSPAQPAPSQDALASASIASAAPHRPIAKNKKAATNEPPVAVQPPAPQENDKRVKQGKQQPTPAPKTETPPGTQVSDKPLRTVGQIPGLDLLNADTTVQKVVDVRAVQQLIEGTLADFNVPVRTVHVESGPTVTQFGVEPLYVESAGQRRKIRVSRIVNLADDLSLALAVPAVRIEAPVPGRPYVGIEVPNAEKAMVSLRGILESKTLQQEGGKLALPLGRNTSGAPVVMDLTRAPHLLIAGATGSGKSVCINTIVTGLLMQHGPDRLRFVMVDPKMVELPGYNGIPHLLGKVITDVEQVMGALTWLLLQMDAYNALTAKPRKGEANLQPLPYLVLIIDELADLMMTAAEDIERQICRLAQMARATGIHLILATQRPSIDVVTGLIKANFPSRIAFAVTSQIDSRVILDTPGAERLLGRGDMLLMRPDMAKLLRIQGCFVADEEISHIVNFWKAQSVEAEAPSVPPWAALLDRLDDEDELLQDAIDAVRELEHVTTSLLQRKMRIGYPKAARLIEQLEAKGVIGPDQGGGQGRPVIKQPTEATEEDDDSDPSLSER